MINESIDSFWAVRRNEGESLKVPFKLLINVFSILGRAFKIKKGGV